MSDKIKTGDRGENLAAEFFKKQGYEVVFRKYRYHRSEIDLIVRRANWTLFVEVKTRTSDYFGQPEEFVSTQQANRIFEAAEQYIYATDWQGNIRFDIVSVKLGANPEIIHFEDAIN